jgi:hypothetical protein
LEYSWIDSYEDPWHLNLIARSEQGLLFDLFARILYWEGFFDPDLLAPDLVTWIESAANAVGFRYHVQVIEFFREFRGLDGDSYEHQLRERKRREQW